jgi:hypothetical protein
VGIGILFAPAKGKTLEIKDGYNDIKDLDHKYEG